MLIIKSTISNDIYVPVSQTQINQLQNSQAELLASINQSEATSRLALKRLRESESSLKQEVQAMRDRMTDMEHELMARKEVVEAANEAIVIKVCILIDIRIQPKA